MPQSDPAEPASAAPSPPDAAALQPPILASFVQANVMVGLPPNQFCTLEDAFSGQHAALKVYFQPPADWAKVLDVAKSSPTLLQTAVPPRPLRGRRVSVA